jgi:hypothetical protein
MPVVPPPRKLIYLKYIISEGLGQRSQKHGRRASEVGGVIQVLEIDRDELAVEAFCGHSAPFFAARFLTGPQAYAIL